jgi:hypothetical protein
MTFTSEAAALSAAYELEVLDEVQVAVEATPEGWTLFVEPSTEWSN